MCVEGLILDGLPEWPASTTRKEWFAITRQLRHSHATHAVRRGVDVFTLQSTLGHASSSTTGHYVAANLEDSSSLRLG